MRWHTLATVALGVAMTGCVAAPPANLATAQLQVIAAETAFAKTMADRDHEAFATFVAEDAVFFAGKNPIRGKAGSRLLGAFLRCTQRTILMAARGS